MTPPDADKERRARRNQRPEASRDIGLGHERARHGLHAPARALRHRVRLGDAGLTAQTPAVNWCMALVIYVVLPGYII